MKRFKNFINVTGLFLLIAVVWFFGPNIILWIYPSLSTDSNYSNLFSVLNSLFTGFAFAGVIISMILQKRELELQRQELQLTRHELSNSAEAQFNISNSNLKQVKIMTATAKLNALTAMLDYYNSYIITNDSAPWVQLNINDSKEKTYEKINEVFFEIEKLEKSDY